MTLYKAKLGNRSIFVQAESYKEAGTIAIAHFKPKKGLVILSLVVSDK